MILDKTLKIAHISDTHIRNFRYHEEYLSAFEDLYAKLKLFKPNYIIHTGDIAHSKCNITPEFIAVCASFLKGLVNIAPTGILLGNHDTNLRMETRKDAISPIVEAIGNPDLFIYNDSVPTPLPHHPEVVIYPFSLMDKVNTWPDGPTPSEQISIVLFHGCISGVKTDSGMVLQKGDVDIKQFERFDYAFLGDIHLSKQFIDETKRRAYAGSTIQQGFGEHTTKGYLEWEIKSSTDSKCTFKKVKNPREFHTIYINEGTLPNVSIPDGSRVRIKSNTAIDRTLAQKFTKTIKEKYNTDFVQDNTIKNISLGSLSSVHTNLKGDITSHIDLVKEFMGGIEAQDGAKEDALGVIQEFLKKNDLDHQQNSQYTLNSLEFSNFFNFGKNNVINFEELEGICGIFGKNYSGKTSLIETICYTMLNKMSKGSINNFDILNKKRNKAEAKMTLEIDGRPLEIHRTIDKFLKSKRTGEEDVHTRVVAKYLDGNQMTVDGETNHDVNKSIRDLLGDYEHFNVSSLVSQFNPLPFIEKKSSERKKVLYGAMGLDICDKMFKEFKAEADFHKKTLETKSVDFDKVSRSLNEEIETCDTKIHLLEQEISGIETSKENLTNTIVNKKAELSSILSASDSVVDIEITNKRIRKLKKQLEILTQEGISSKELLEHYESLVDGSFDLEKAKSELSELNNSIKSFKETKREIESSERDLKHIFQLLKIDEKKAKNIEVAPCHGELDCFYLKDAFGARENLQVNNQRKTELSAYISEISSGFSETQIRELEKEVKSITNNKKKQEEYSRNIKQIQTELANKRLKFEKIQKNLQEAEEDKVKWEENKDSYRKIKNLEESIDKLEQRIFDYNRKLQKLRKEKSQHQVQTGKLQSKLSGVFESEDKYKETLRLLEVFSLLAKIYHGNGFPAWILESKLPLINAYINEFIRDVANIKIDLEFLKNKLNIYLSSDGESKRPIELCSGAEKTIASLAIKLGLRKLTTMPLADFLILDEPGVWLDADNIPSYIKFLERVKEEFRFVLLITHMEQLKDCCDEIIEIGNEKGFAYVNR